MSRSINTSPQVKNTQDLRRSSAASKHADSRRPRGGRYGVKVSLRKGREV